MVVANAYQVCFLEAKTKEDAVRSMVSELDMERRGVFEAVMQREKVISTGIGMGIAIPHAKISGLDEFSVVIGIVKHEGIEWDAIDHLLVKLIILICGPDNKHREYLHLLSRLTKTIKLESVRQELFLAKDQEEIVKIFEAC